ncbi:glycerol-3-phosphate acyltransferase-like protein, partial [Euroglyphus maynei]
AIEQVSCDQYHNHQTSLKTSTNNVRRHQDVKDQIEYQKFIRKNRHKAYELFEDISSCISSSLLRIAGWILYRLLSRMFNSVQFSKAQIEQIRQKQKLINKQQQQQQRSDIPIIYLPLHRSYLDCILITFILSMNGLSPPLIAINEHFSITIFNHLIRGLGAFFVGKKSPKNSSKRSTNDAANGDGNNNDNDNDDDDPIHDAILRSYIIENLRQGNSLEFFLENSRTSTGKVLMPNLHLLSIVLDALADGMSIFICLIFSTVCIVPVSISYEKSIEGTDLVVREQMELPPPSTTNTTRVKSSESFLTTIMTIWSTLRSNYGTVRVDFGKPFILNEYIDQCMAQQQIQQQLVNEQHMKQMMNNDLTAAANHHHDESSNTIPRTIDYGVTIADCVACPPSLDRITQCKKNNNKLSTIKLLNHSNNNNNDNENNDPEEIRRRYRCCCDSLAKHVLYDAYRDSSLMSTHLVAFLLLNKYRSKSTTIDQLSIDLDWLRQTICRDKQQNLSLNGDSHSLIRQAIQLLRQEDLIQIEKVRLKWSSWNHNNGRNYHQQRNSWNDDEYDDNDGGNIKSDSRLEIIYLKPTNKLPSLLHLQHYSNYCSSLFVFESVLGIHIVIHICTANRDLITHL